MTTGNNYMSGVAQANARLPKDQQALADAAAESTSSGSTEASSGGSNVTANVVNEAMNWGGYEYLAGAAAKEIGTKYALPRVASVGATTMTYGPHAMALAGGYQLGTELDKEYDISGKIANTIIPDNKNGLPAFSDKEKQLMGAGYNLNRPIYETNVQGAPTLYGRPNVNREIVGYEKMPNYNEMDEFAATEMAKIERETPPVPDSVGNYQELFAKREQMSPEDFRIGLEKIATEGNNYGNERIANIEAGRPAYEEGVKNVDSTVPLNIAQARNEAGMQEVYSAPEKEFETMYQKDNQMFGIQRGNKNIREAVQNPTPMSEGEVKRFNQSSEALNTPIVSGTPEAGLKEFTDRNGNIAYGNEAAIAQFDPSAPKPDTETTEPTEAPITRGEELQASFELYKESGKEMTEDQIAQAEDIAGEAGRTFSPETGYSPEFNQEIQDQYNEDQRAAEERFNPPPPEPTPLTEQEEEDQALMENARENGRSEEYIEDMMEAIRERRADVEESEPPDPSKVNSLYKMMENQGVTQDPVTGELIVDSEGFLGFDSTKPLARGSALYQQLEQTKEGRYILNVLPPDIRSMENDKDLPDGGVFEADDGRRFEYKNGSFTLFPY